MAKKSEKSKKSESADQLVKEDRQFAEFWEKVPAVSKKVFKEIGLGSLVQIKWKDHAPEVGLVIAVIPEDQEIRVLSQREAKGNRGYQERVDFTVEREQVVWVDRPIEHSELGFPTTYADDWHAFPYTGGVQPEAMTFTEAPAVLVRSTKGKFLLDLKSNSGGLLGTFSISKTLAGDLVKAGVQHDEG